MDLHRVTGASDWANTKPSDYNSWQAIAARTNGIVTLGNGLTLFGFGLVVAGLAAIITEQYWPGLALLAIGRLCDIADGIAADKTGTKSALGESLDAGFDKLGTVLAAGVFIYAAVAPRWILIGLILPHAAMAIIFLVAKRRAIRIHPSRIGKLSMAALWASLVGYIAVKALDFSSSSLLAIICDIVACVSVLAGAYVALGYARKLK